MTEINIYFSTGENPELSNLYPRPFIYKGYNFRSVEHAYQTLKSGSFDDKAYYSKEIKPIGKYKVKEEYSLILMKDLIKESLNQKPTHKIKLLETGKKIITHKQADEFWAKYFPKILMEIREEFLREEVMIRN